jgi:predicted nucleic acid-binding protein
VTSGLLVTSVVIAAAAGEELDLPDRVAISVVTLCELHHGVLVAADVNRAGRLNVLVNAERTFEALPIDARVAPHFGRLVAAARRKSGRRPKVADALVAATALSHGLQLFAKDRDFEQLDVPGLVLL